MRVQELYDVEWRNIKQLTFHHMEFFGKMLSRREARPRDLVQGVAILLLLLCRRFRLEPRDVLETAARVTRSARENDPDRYVQAVEAYLREELTDE